MLTNKQQCRHIYLVSLEADDSGMSEDLGDQEQEESEEDADEGQEEEEEEEATEDEEEKKTYEACDAEDRNRLKAADFKNYRPRKVETLS